MSKRKEKIIDFFSNLLANANKDNFESMVEQSISLFEEIAYIMKSDKEEEKKEIEEGLKVVNEKIAQQFDQVCEEMGVSREEVDAIVNDPKNFSPEIWNTLQGLQSKVSLTEKEKKPVQKKNIVQPKKWISA